MTEVAIIFGRFNPPHFSHVAAWQLAAQSPIWYVGTNENTIGPDDPLPFKIKQQAVHALYPEIEGHFVAEKNWLSMAHAIYEKYGDVHLKLVTDEDWVPALINQYNGREGKHGSYKFSRIEHVVPDRLSSATELRNAVKNNDRQAFANAAGVPANFEIAGMPYFDLVAKYLLPYQDDVTESNELTVQFHDKLNPAIWAEDKKMLPEVRSKLLKIADDFKEFLGVEIGDLHDITVSGSNAAFNYNDGSDIDLHLVTSIAKLDNSQTHRQLFDAKKYQYNATHDYKIRGYDVELYVQDADQPHYSSGIYSIQNDEWVVEPKPSQTGYDPAATADKYQHLKQLFELALKSKNLKLAEKLKATMKKYRAAGLKETGEFGPENLAFKALRSNGYIEKLFDLIAALQDKELSLETKLDEVEFIDYAGAENTKNPAVRRGYKTKLSMTDPVKLVTTVKNWDIYLSSSARSSMHFVGYFAYNRTTNAIDMLVEGKFRNTNYNWVNFYIEQLDGRKNSKIKAHEFYHAILMKQNVIFTTDKQSLGGMKVWQKLASYPDITVFGWNSSNKGNPKSRFTQVDMDDFADTHIDYDELKRAEDETYDDYRTPDLKKAKQDFAEVNRIFNMKLVAHRKTEKPVTENALDNAQYVDQQLIKYANWPGGANKYIIKKAERLDEIIKLLKVTAYMPEIRIFGSANRTDDSMPERIQIYIDANRIQLGKELAKQGLDSIASIINHYKGMLQAFVKFDKNLYTYKDGKWVKTNQQVSKDGMPLTLFDRSFKQIAYAGLAEDIQLDEISMSPTSLAKFATTPIAKSMRVGFEFEMLVPGLEPWDDDDRSDWREEDWDYDRPLNIDNLDDIWTELENFYTNASMNEIKAAYDVGTNAIDNEIEKLLDEHVVANADNFKSLKKGSTEYNTAVRDYKTKLVDEQYPTLLEKALEALELDLISGWTKMGLRWPHYLDSDEDEDTVSAETFASSIGKVVGNEVVVLSEYHGEQKEPYYWYLEPDSSITSDLEYYTGAELVSPPMSLNVGMSILDKFFAFAAQYGIDSNESTGLHINLSASGRFMDEIDPLKLILFLGDKYVLNQFGREANEYCKSSMERIEKSAASFRTLENGLDAIRKGINQIALESLKKLLIQTNDKYVSVHIKRTHVEFRSVGGYYFEQKELIKNTLLRYAQSFALALDPAAEKNEYLKKIYKTLTEANPVKDSSVDLFAMHYIGKISTAELKDRLRDAFTQKIVKYAQQ